VNSKFLAKKKESARTTYFFCVQREVEKKMNVEPLLIAQTTRTPCHFLESRLKGTDLSLFVGPGISGAKMLQDS
jgi:hypothetical protein